MPPLMILVAGPYHSGTNDDPALIARNVSAMTDTSLQLFRSGHLPVMGVVRAASDRARGHHGHR